MPAPTTAALAIARGAALRDVGQLDGVALGEEQVPQGPGLGRDDAFGEQLALTPRSVVERQREAALDRLDRRVGRDAGPGRTRQARPRVGARRLTGGGLPGIDRDGAGRTALAGGGPRHREGHGVVQNVVVDHRVDDPGSERLRRRDRLARRAHAQGHRRAAEPRQPLRATGAGNQSEQHLRLADGRVSRGHPIVAGHGQLETAAERVSVNRRHHRLGDVFEASQHGVATRRSLERGLTRRQRVEGGDVRASHERPAVTGEDDGIDRAVSGRSHHHLFERGPHGRRQRVDGRVGDGQHGHPALHLVVHDGHGTLQVGAATDWRRIRGQDELGDVLAVFHHPVRRRRLGQREGRVDQHANGP